METIPDPIQLDAWGFEGPDWRWKLAQKRAADSSIAPSEDVWVQGAAEYLALRGRSPKEARQRFPHLAAAEDLWRNDAQQRELVLLTLSRSTAAQIATRLKATEAAVEWARQLYFDVAERLHATDWMHLAVFKPRQQTVGYEHASECRAALYGGPYVAEKILDADATFGLPPDRRLAALEAKLSIRTQAALAMPFNEKDRMKLLKLNAEVDRIGKQLDLAREKYADRCADIRSRVERKYQRAAAEKIHRAGRAQHQDLLRQHFFAAFAAEERAAVERAAASPLQTLTWTKAEADAVAPPTVPTSPAATVSPVGPPQLKRRRSASAPRRQVATGVL